MEQAPNDTDERGIIRRFGTILAVAAFAVVATGVFISRGNNTVRPSEFATTPTWQQDFTGMSDSPPDPNVWRYDLDPEVPTWNNEAQGYTDRLNNVRVEAGRLILDVRKEPYIYPTETKGRSYNYTSARIDTKHSFSFRYGKIEASMKMPEGGGAWPAFWLLSATEKYSKARQPTPEERASEGFYAHDGEIDIMEYTANNGCKIYGTVHTYDTMRRKAPHTGEVTVPDCTTTFHTYGLEWTPTSLTFTVDGKAYHTVHKQSDNPEEWPFNQPMYVILNHALGGEMGAPVDPRQTLWRAEIKHVKYFSYKEKAG